MCCVFFFQAEDGIRDLVRSRGLGDVYKRQLISGRNPEFLIGNQVLAAPYVKKSGIEAISTGYILIDGGAPTTVSYISNTTPIPVSYTHLTLPTSDLV